MQYKDVNPDVGRQVISIRAQPALKNHLTQESIHLGITLSQHCENIISTRNETQKKLEKLVHSNDQKDRQVKQLTAQVNSLPSKQVQSILADERLLFLFENLKGKTDVIENAYGDDFSIVYETPEDLLRAFIYAIKLKK